MHSSPPKDATKCFQDGNSMNLRPAVAVIPHVASNPTSFGSPPIYAWSFSSRRVKRQPRSSCAGSPYPCHRPSVNHNTFRSSNMAGKSMKFSWENPPISVDFHKNRMIQKKKRLPKSIDPVPIENSDFYSGFSH